MFCFKGEDITFYNARINIIINFSMHEYLEKISLPVDDMLNATFSVME